MKKLFTIILTFLLVFLILPIQGFALENKALENAIYIAKSRLDIKDGYDQFNYSIYNINGKMNYQLSWSDTKNKLGNVSATVDSTGKILSYYSYKPYYEQSDRSKLPSISKADALKIADAFLQKVNPSIYSKLKYQENNQPININDIYYYFNYIRVENGIPFYNNNVNLSINNRTGEIQNFYCEWNDDYIFPDAIGIMDIEKAQQIYKEKLSLQLIYKLNYENEGIKPYLAYSFINNNKAIDAKTGDVVNINAYYGPMYGKGDFGGMKNASSTEQSILSPEEIKAIESSTDLLDEKKAEEIGRKVLNIDYSYKLESINLYNDWINKDDHIWSMSFVNNNNINGPYYYASIALDAKTGEVMNFYRSIPYDSNATPKYDKNQSLKIAQYFITNLEPEKAKEIEYVDRNSQDIKPLDSTEMPRGYYFTFTRKANEIYFPDNSINITVDTTQGIVMSYNLSWYKKDLPKADDIITSEKAHEILFNKIGLEAQYVADYSADSKATIPTEPNMKPDIKIVYSIKYGKPVNIDAITGKLLDYSGKLYNETLIPEYSDISGNSAEKEIKILAQYGISLPGSEFKPESNISQRDFLYLIAKSLNAYIDNEISNNSDDALYNYLINLKILKENEKCPSSLINRQDAVKYIIRAMKYDHVADIKGIYYLNFYDNGSINPDLFGYIAIAYGLNIIKDESGYIKPADYITRADAVVMLFNMLNAE